MGIVRCIIGNAFCSTTDLQVPSVCTSFVKFGIYWEKNKEDRLVHNHEISVPPQTFRAKHGLATSVENNFVTVSLTDTLLERKSFKPLNLIHIFAVIIIQQLIGLT